MRTSPCASACRSARLKIHGQGHRALPAVQPGKRRFHEQRHHPEQRRALKMAAHWYALLCDEHVTDRQRQQWQARHQQHDDHRWARQRVEALQSQLQGVPGKFSYRALDRAGRQSAIDRRTLLKSLLLLLGVGGSGFLPVAARPGAARRLPHRHRRDQTHCIKRRHPAGAEHRQRGGRALRRSPTADPPARRGNQHGYRTRPRPLWVQSPQGAMRALGTRFWCVRVAARLG